ncbi:hypothetical protein B484DRAFT_392426, partial [Ochromonadaceae sp. CCMP2298]
HIPYRDSKLTRLLQGCLGGAARTAVVVTLAPGTDSAGETLSALRFASRASRVAVAASRGAALSLSRYRDYEALYLEAQGRIADLAGGGGGGDRGDRGRVAELEALLRQRGEEKEAQREEIHTLQQQVRALQGGPSAPAPTPSTSTSYTPTTASAAASAVSEVAAEWGGRVQALTQQHLQDMAEAQQRATQQLRRAQASEAEALSAQSALLGEVRVERERSLEAVRGLRVEGERRLAEEGQTRTRVAELLQELQSLRDGLEESQEQLHQSQEELLKSQEEVGRRVTVDQVREMEGLFLDTVARLSER